MPNHLKPARTVIASAVVALALLGAGCSSGTKEVPEDQGPAYRSTTSTTAVGQVVSSTLAPIDPGSVEGGEDAYLEAMIPMIQGTTGIGDLSDDKVECIAERWVAAIGLDTFAAAGVTPELLGTSQGSLDHLTIGTDQATEMAKAFGRCDVNLKRITVDQLAAGSESTALRACLEDRLSKGAVEEAFAAGISGNPTGAQKFQRAAEDCRKGGD